MSARRKLPAEDPPLWDPVAAWDALSPARQRALGSLMLTYNIASYGAALNPRKVGVPRVRALRTAYDEAHAGVVNLIDAAFSNILYEPPRPDLNKLGIRMCAACGCTEHHGCAGGCSWAGPTLCTACEAPRVDPIDAFLALATRKNRKLSVPATVLYRVYVAWCRHSALLKPRSVIAFGRALGDRGISRFIKRNRTDAAHTRFNGITLTAAGSELASLP